MAKGDKIKVYFSVGDRVEIAEVEARQNGRRLELEQSKSETSVTEVTRGGTQVRRVWFPASAVVCIDSEMRGDD